MLQGRRTRKKYRLEQVKGEKKKILLRNAKENRAEGGN